MHWRLHCWLARLVVATGGLLAVADGQAQEFDELAQRWGLASSEFVVRGQIDEAPVQPFRLSDPYEISIQSGTPVLPGADEGSLELAELALRAVSSPVQETVTAREAKYTAPIETGSLLQNSTSVQSVGVQHRSPVSLDPYLRGYRFEQVLANADGAMWLPVRRDLDSMISRIDPTLIRSVEVLPGPYGLRYGPGLAHLNISTYDTPRYLNGHESHFRTGFTARENGGQVYGRETVFGGDADWGYIASWSVRSGADYDPGDAAPFDRIPSSYKSQNFLGQFGFDLSADSKIEVRYNRMDMTDTEYPVQFFDVNFLGSDAISATYTRDNECHCTSLSVDSWYNFTRFNGNTDGPGKRAPFSVIDRVENAININLGLPTGTSQVFGNTWGDLTSAGGRVVKTYGEPNDRQLSLGADVRYVEQRLREQFFIANLPVPSPLPDNPFFTNMPRAELIDPGVFFEWRLPWACYLTTSLGGRLDWARTDADAQALRTNTALGNGQNFTQEDVLYAFYLSNQLEVDSQTSITFGGGHGQRPPSLIDRYADQIFLGILQSGFSRVIGNPNLAKERTWQVDAGVKTDAGFWYGSVNGFYAWIDNYNLYQGDLVTDPTGARLLRATNAEFVTLGGVEAMGEMFITQRLSAFGTFRYLSGRDRNIAIQGQPQVTQPLYGIVPAEGRVGLRLTDSPSSDENRWGLEFGVRMVDDQSQVSSLRQGQATIVGLVPFEEATPGFTTLYVRGYWNPTRTLNLVGGIENLADRAYYEHLDLRLPATTTAQQSFAATRVFAPGITPYVGVEWTY